MSRLTRRPFAAALAVSLAVAAGGMAFAQPAGAATRRAAKPSAVTGATTYLVADMTGANEVRTAATPAGDDDGFGFEIIAITGNEVRYAIAWSKIAPPTGAHIHSGITGVNGPIKVAYFGAPGVPNTVTAVLGRVTTPDTALLDAIKADPGAYYANLHNVQYPGGAIRGQFRMLDQAIDLDTVLGTGFLRAHANGANEISAAGAPGAGDPNGLGWAGIDATGHRVAFALKWAGIAPPTAAHIHVGIAGSNGPVVVPFFAATDGLPKSITGVAGYVSKLDSSLVALIRRYPGNFYVNLHTAEYPSGAVRGQLRLRPQSDFGF